MFFYRSVTTLQRFEINMLFAKAPSGGHAPFARRLRCLLLAGAAVAMGAFSAHAQDSGLRGSLPDDTGLAGTAATEDEQPDDNATPSERAMQAARTEAGQDAPADNAADTEQPAVALDNMRVNAITATPDDDMGRMQRENQPAPPEQGSRRSPEDDPFAPLGIRIGRFLLRPSLEQGIRVTSNGDSSSTGSSAVLSETTLRFYTQSDWSRHQATLDAAGTFSKSISGQDVSEPQLDIQGNLRLDLSEQTTVEAGAGYKLRRESASNPYGVTDAKKRPLVHTFNGSLGVEREVGLIFGRATGRIEHDLYGDAELSTGGTLSQKDRDNTYASLTLRGGFELSPALKPFAEVELGKRIFDQRYDGNGYERSGTQYALRGGLMFDRGEKFNGEISAGFMRVNSDDSRLDDVTGPSFAAALNWSPLRGTDVRLYAQTLMDISTTPGQTGSLLHYASLGVTRKVRSNLSLNGQLDALVRDNEDGTGTDYTIGAQVGATYWFNRFFGLDTRLRHEFLTSRESDREYKSSSVYVGLKLQR